jgi:GNAT superfamily N-acetyltransferase
VLELNQAEWFRLRRWLPWVEFRDEGDALSVSAKAWPRNTIAHARFTPSNAWRRVRELQARHAQANAGCYWFVGPLSQPADLEQHLRAQGFRCLVRDAGMACDLVTASHAVAPPSGVVIDLVDKPPALAKLNTERRRQRQRGRELLAGTKPKVVWNFSANIGERAVGEATLFAAAGVAGLYDVEVLKEFRRRGIGTALVQAALDKARELGFSVAVLGATDLGQGVYARLGFRQVCRLSVWKCSKLGEQRPARKVRPGRRVRPPGPGGSRAA